MKTMTPLSGKHALVTGGGSGIGLAIAQSLAQAGATVTITGRRRDVLEAASGPNISPLPMDVCDESSVVDGMAKAASDRGPIDICIANAGIAEGQNILKSDFAFWRRIMATNLDGTYLTVREALRHMPTREWGRVIAISSIAGVKALKGAHAYTASKHGVTGLMRTLAADFATSAVTFNCICPAYVDTDIVSQNQSRLEERMGLEADKARQIMLDLNPHGRLIAPEEIAQTALWLCAPGSESVNGAAIEVAGGPL